MKIPLISFSILRGEPGDFEVQLRTADSNVTIQQASSLANVLGIIHAASDESGRIIADHLMAFQAAQEKTP